MKSFDGQIYLYVRMYRCLYVCIFICMYVYEIILRRNYTKILCFNNSSRKKSSDQFSDNCTEIGNAVIYVLKRSSVCIYKSIQAYVQMFAVDFFLYYFLD